MSTIKGLIDKLCPNGVEYKALSEITSLTAGDRIIKSMMNDDMEFPVYGGGVNPTGKYEKYNFMNAITISRAGSAGYVNWVEGKFWATDVCFVASQKSEEYNIKYIYYYVKNKQAELQTKIYGGNLPKLNKDYLWKLPIAVPPLEIQCEIVKVLDNLSDCTAKLTDELTSEFNSRKQQLDYYKNSLFNFNENVDYIELGDMCDLVTKQTGFDYTKSIKASLIKEKKEDTLPYLQTKFFSGRKFDFETDYFIPTEVAKKFPKILLNKKCILFSIVGASIGNVGLFDGERECFLGGAICVAKVSEKYNIEYLYHYLTSHYGQKQIFSKVKGAGQATVTIEDIRKFRIPLPSIETQNTIVHTLNNLDDLVSKIIEVIPAEIEKRQKQYEYYRDRLLSFKEAEVNE